MGEQNNGRGVFYGVIGVATLIVAIVGATFAFFSASANNNTSVVGNTSEASDLTLTIEKKAASGNLIPMNDSDLSKGITGESSKNCVDANGNTVCHVYEIKLTNGKSPVKINGDISFSYSDDTTGNLTYKVVAVDKESAQDLSTLATAAKTDYTGTIYSTSSTLASGTSYAADATKYYYVVVWLEEISAAQEDVDSNKQYTGTVSFNAASGGGVTATFSS